MDRRTFVKYLMAGHGRCYDEVKRSPERYKKDIMKLCLEDTSFDMQCEGTRAYYAYDLVMLYDDITPFVRRTVRAFTAAGADDTSHQFWHLCGLVCRFAIDSGNETALDAVLKKYRQLHDMLMTRRYSAFIHDVQSNFEYVAINLFMPDRWDYAEMIAHDVGAWFIKRRREDREDLRWSFLWLWHEMNDVYGKDAVTEHFAPLCRTSKEIRRFIDIMDIPEERPKRTEKPAPDADAAIKLVTEGAVATGYDMLRNGFYRMNDSEAEKIAGAVIKEPDEHKKSLMLAVFRSDRMRWPESVEYLIEYAQSGSEELRNTALKALACANDRRAAEYAAKMLSDGVSDTEEWELYLSMLIKNCTDSDEALVLSLLDSIQIDRENAYETGWHGIVLDIVNSHNDDLPDAVYMWVYENSLCSCCRRNAAEKLIERGAFPEECMRECLHDCNTDVRELVTGDGIQDTGR